MDKFGSFMVGILISVGILILGMGVVQMAKRSVHKENCIERGGVPFVTVSKVICVKKDVVIKEYD